MSNTVPKNTPKEEKQSSGLPTVVVIVALVVVVVLLGILAYKTLGPTPEVIVHKDPVALIRRGRTDPGSLTPHERVEYEHLTHGAPLGGGVPAGSKPPTQ